MLNQNSAEESLVVYRTANLEYLGKLQNNDVVTARNYWSTSLDRSVTEHFLKQEGTLSYYVD